MLFDTSVIPSGSIVSSATLGAAVYTDRSDTDFNIVAKVKSWTPPLVASMYVTGPNLATYGVKVATLSTVGISLNTVYTFTDVALAANIVVNGTTYMLLHSDRQQSGTAPSGNEYVYISATGVNQPRLVITYSSGSVASGGILLATL